VYSSWPKPIAARDNKENLQFPVVDCKKELRILRIGLASNEGQKAVPDLISCGTQPSKLWGSNHYFDVVIYY
jgi:hypothetical protein